MLRLREPRYLGYRDVDRQQPYAKYMKARVDPPQPHVVDAVVAGPVDPTLIPPPAELPDDLHRPGCSRIETGYGQLPTGEVWVACLTHMPRVEPEMWEWWFAWHSLESARYKLWHPESHAHASLRHARPERLDPTDMGSWEGNVSYVDEVIGGHLDQLAIAPQDPARYGIDTSRFDGIAVVGTVGTVLAPVNVGLACHQVRRVEGGSEMRSRFYLNVPGVRRPDLRAAAHAVRRGVAKPRSPRFKVGFGADLLRHCGEEMNHLAQFLPELHAEFS